MARIRVWTHTDFVGCAGEGPNAELNTQHWACSDVQARHIMNAFVNKMPSLKVGGANVLDYSKCGVNWLQNWTTWYRGSNWWLMPSTPTAVRDSLGVVRACLCVDGIDACGCVGWLLLGGKRDRLAGRTMGEAGRPPVLLITRSLCACMCARACYELCALACVSTGSMLAGV